MVFTSNYWPLAFPAFYLGAPIAHLSHKAPAKAAISELLRIGVPYATGLIGAQMKHCDVGNPEACAHGVHPGAVLGAIAVSAFDAAFLAQRSVLESALPAPRQAGITRAPRASADRHGFTLGMHGTF